MSARRSVLLLATSVLLAVAACSENRTGFDWNRMRTQPKYMSYGPSTFFTDGKVMQAPQPGTVSRESGAAPADSSAPDPARGRNRFTIFCAVCHGDRADGRSLVASNMDPPRPPSLLVDSIRRLTDARIDSVIANGYGRMPAFAGDLHERDRRAVIAWLRHLQQTSASIDSTRPPRVLR